MKLERFRRRTRAWGRRQLFSLFSSLGTLMSHRAGTLMTVLVLGIAMALPVGLYVTVKNLRALDLKQEQWGTITVFLKTEADQDAAQALNDMINGRVGMTSDVISPAQGMAQFREASGFGQALDMFEENPLPWVVLVTPQPAEDVPLEAAVAQIEEWLLQQEDVDLVQVDFKWLQRLAGLLALGDALISVLTVFFSLAVVVVVSNTIRMDVANRSEEIQVLSLVGAGEGFIRQPFLYSGFWYGLLGATLALLLFNGCLFYLKRPLEGLLDAYGNSFTVHNLDGVGVLFVFFAGGFLGFIGAWVSVQRYLRMINTDGMLGRF